MNWCYNHSSVLQSLEDSCMSEFLPWAFKSFGKQSCKCCVVDNCTKDSMGCCTNFPDTAVRLSGAFNIALISSPKLPAPPSPRSLWTWQWHLIALKHIIINGFVLPYKICPWLLTGLIWLMSAKKKKVLKKFKILLTSNPSVHLEKKSCCYSRSF